MRVLKFKAPKNVLIAGHRGYPAKLTENTLASFQAATNSGVDMIETDIRITKDKHLVLIHDSSAERVGGNSRLIRDMTLEEVMTLRIGKEKASIPTLDDLFGLFSDNKTLLYNIEIKVYSHEEGIEAVHDTVVQAVALCQKFDVCDRVIFNSFDAYVLEYIYKNYGNRFKLHGYYPYSIMENITDNPNNYLDYACFWAHGEEAKAFCDYLKQHGIEPCTGSDTTETQFYEAAKYGCSMFTLDDPAKAIEWRKKL